MYTELVGKPFEISFQYAEIMANKIALAKGQSEIKKIYFIGYVILAIRLHSFSCFLLFRDNPEVDIVGANIYNEWIQQSDSSMDNSLTGSDVLVNHPLISAEECESILVCTGVYDPKVHTIETDQPWKIPTTIQYDVLAAVNYVLTKEKHL